MTFAFSDFVQSKVSIYASYYEDSSYKLGKLTDIEGDGNGFGNMLDLAGDHTTGKMLFVAEKENTVGEGSAYIFSGKWDQWTNVRTIC